MTRKWGISGIGDFNLVKGANVRSSLSEAGILKLKEELLNIDSNISEDWLEHLQGNIALYAWSEDAKNSTKPAKIRAHLQAAIRKCKAINFDSTNKQLLKEALDFNDAVNDLDMGARALLEGGVSKIYKHIEVIVADTHNVNVGVNKRSVSVRINKCQRMLESALCSADDFPHRGRLDETHKTQLANQIGLSLKQLGHTPTSTSSGLFVLILEIIFSDIHNKTFLGLHSMAESALAMGLER